VNIPQVYKLITHLDKHLKYLSLEIDKSNLQISSILLKEFDRILPDSLEYLSLDLVIDPNDLKIFLDNCKYIVGLNKLLIRNSSIKNVDLTFNILKEFVRRKRIKNFAYQINSYFNPNNLEHCNLEKLVNESQPFVKTKRYSDLVVRITDFDVY